MVILSLIYLHLFLRANRILVGTSCTLSGEHLRSTDEESGDIKNSQLIGPLKLIGFM